MGDAQVEEGKPFAYDLKKWILDVEVREVLKGGVEGEKIKAKCGTLNLIFGDEDVQGREFVLLLLEKSGWHKEYSLVGAQVPRENLTDWIRKKYSPAD